MSRGEMMERCREKREQMWRKVEYGWIEWRDREETETSGEMEEKAGRNRKKGNQGDR